MPFYQCSDCDRGFTRRDNYRRHRRNRHRSSSTTQERSVCGRCWSIFGRQDVCRRHITTIHADRAYVPIHSYYEVMNRDLTEFQAQHLNNPNWFGVPSEYSSINSQEFRNWAMSYNPPELPALISPISTDGSSTFIVRNTSTTATNATNQVNRLLYLDDSFNTNNTNNNVSDNVSEPPVGPHTPPPPSPASSDLEDHSYVVNNSTPHSTSSQATISLPPSTTASPANPFWQGGTLDFSLSDCDLLADLLDEYHDDPPLCIEGSPSGINTRLILTGHQETTDTDSDNSVPDLVPF